MIDWDTATIAAAATAEVLRGAPAECSDDTQRRRASGTGPARVVIDSREVRDGDLFVGLPGSRSDGGDHAPEALARGAWGVLVAPESARAALAAQPTGAVLAHPDPLAALQRLASAWRARLDAQVVGITGSTGKTSTKDILAALVRSDAAGRLRTVASQENFNTEIGLPLAILSAPTDIQVLVLEMAMRGPGQIAELTAIARPDVGVVLNIGPVHLEQLGSLEAVAAAKAELIAGLAPGARAVLPADERLLDPYRRADLETVTFGPGGDVELVSADAGGEVVIRVRERTLRLRPSFAQAHNLRNLLAAVAVADALGVHASGPLDVGFSSLRGERVELPGGALIINDCYNANPMSMRAALDDLAATADGRRVAVLGDMLELGPREEALHRELGEYVAARRIELLVTVGPRAKAIGAGVDRVLRGGAGQGFAIEVHAVASAADAAALLASLLRPGDCVLVKGSRGMRLEQVAQALNGAAQDARAAVGGRT
jgi:UDP-N-acetylmuramoyl-tripeptide--D-alanyl-D-alanine ligase